MKKDTNNSNEVTALRQSLSIYDEKLKPILKEKGKLHATKFLFDLKLGYGLRELKDYIDYFSSIVLSFEIQERDRKVNEYDSLIEENKMLLEALKKFLQVINRSVAALYHYQDAITLGEEAINKAESK